MPGSEASTTNAVRRVTPSALGSFPTTCALVPNRPYTVHSDPPQPATAPPLSKHGDTITAPSFAAGFLLAVANPKAYVAIAAVFAGTTLGVASKTAVLAVMIVVIHVCWLLAGASLSRIFYDPVSARIANVVFAAALAVTTVFAFI